MIDFLRDVITILVYFFFDFVPTILTAPLGALGDFKDALDGIKWLIGCIPIAIGAAIAFYKKYIR